VRVDEVPQDEIATFAGGRKAMYAVDAEGRYALVPSSGWEVEQIVTHQAIQALNDAAAGARAQALAGSVSPLLYHMYRRRMDLDLLAQTTGLMRWRIRRHFVPRRFARLKPALLQRYADALGIDVQALQRVD
jgi:hypothetical protein